MKFGQKPLASVVAIAILLALSACGDSSGTQSAPDPSPSPSATSNKYSFEQYAAAQHKMNVTVDNVTNAKTLQDKSSSIYVNSNAFMAYIDDSSANNVSLHLRISYTGTQWLFIQSYLINADGQQFTITPTQVQRDNGIRYGQAMVWEWYDYIPSADDISMLDAIATSKSAIIRSYGQQYKSDRTITQQEKAALENVLIEYDALSNSVKIPTSIAASANASASASASAASAVASAKVAAYQNRVCRASKADEAQIESAYADNADSGYPLDGGGAMIGDAGDAGWGQGTEVTTRFDKMIQKILDIATKPNDFSTSSAASAFREFHSFCG